MKKYSIMRCNNPKFRCFVVETAFLRNLEGGVLNKYKILSFYGQVKEQYWQKTLLDDLPGGGPPPIMKRNKIMSSKFSG